MFIIIYYFVVISEYYIDYLFIALFVMCREFIVTSNGVGRIQPASMTFEQQALVT